MTPASIRNKNPKTSRLTVSKARELLTYDAESGSLKWRLRTGNKVPPDLTAGYVDHEGYRVIRIDGVNFRAHRVIWLMAHGEWPSAMIDHVNGDRSDNRLANLRQATNAQNQMNKKARTTGASGFKGKAHVSGYFDTPEDAHEHYKREAVRVFGEFAKT